MPTSPRSLEVMKSMQKLLRLRLQALQPRIEIVLTVPPHLWITVFKNAVDLHYEAITKQITDKGLWMAAGRATDGLVLQGASA